MVPCVSWLRLLVTALLCVAGVARPVAHRCDASSAVRVHEPMHVSMPVRDAELSRIGKRAVDDLGDAPGLVAAPFVAFVGQPSIVRPHAVDELRLPSAACERSRARGPPLG